MWRADRESAEKPADSAPWQLDRGLLRDLFMTPQEIQVLQKFLTQLAQAHVSAKDPEAEAMISRAVAQQPDAAYLLVQRTLLLEQPLQQAKSQLARLQEQRDSVGGGTGAWSQPSSSTPGTGPAPASTPQVQAPPQAAGTNTGLGGFLGNAATTAAGVAGGAFLFQGLEGLFGHHGGGFLGGNAPTENVENVTVNEYSGDGEPSRFPSADDSDRNDHWDDAQSSRSASADDLDVNNHSGEAEPSEFASADDRDAGLDEDDFDDDSSWDVKTRLQ
jgi:uncharacterized protein